MLGCVIMAAGNAVRFGANKLEAELNGKPLIRRAFEAVPAGVFDRVVVVTQYPAVAALAREFGFEPVRNDRPGDGLSRTVRLGTQALAQCDGIARVILHSLEIMEWQVMQHTISTADFTLVPALSHINPASIAQAEECIRIGREEAERRMPKILEAMRQKRELLHEEIPPAKEG